MKRIPSSFNCAGVKFMTNFHKLQLVILAFASNWSRVQIRNFLSEISQE